MSDTARDNEAIRRCLAGDREAFGEMVERYKRPLYAVAYRLLGDSGLAEDAVQETFLRAYRALGRFRLGDPLAPWLYRIATNRCHDLARARGWQSPGLDEDQMERLADPADQPDEALTRWETRRRVRGAVAALPEALGDGLAHRLLVLLPHLPGREDPWPEPAWPASGPGGRRGPSAVLPWPPLPAPPWRMPAC